jgi:hypothetical protein
MGRVRFAAVVAVAAACVLGTAGAAAVARADAPDVAQRARDAYERGTAAYARGDFPNAAREFAGADALLPNATALQAALDAALRADDPVVGMMLLERAGRAPASGELLALVKTARARFAGRTGRVRVTCGKVPCLAAVDGIAVDVVAPSFVRVGPHTVTVQSEGTSEQRLIDVSADEVVEVTPARDARTATTSPAILPAPIATQSSPSPSPSSSGVRVVAPVWFFTALGLTAVVGGATIASGVDAASQHASFVRAGCDRAASAGCDRASSDGLAAQLRTNVLLGVTAGAGIATAALGIFFVKWTGDAEVTVGALHGAPAVYVRTAW